MKRFAIAAAAIAAAAIVPAPHAYAHGRAPLAGEDAFFGLISMLLIGSAVGYALGLRALAAAGAAPHGIRRSAVLFAGGWVVLALALVSPFAAMTEGLFSAHMIQHELMMVIAAPLLVLGRPLAIWTWALPGRRRSTTARLLRGAAFSAVWSRLTSPLGATLVHGAAIWMWHIPRLFEMSEASAGAHAVQHVAFLFSAVLFWWALLKPARGGRIGAAVGCLFITMLHTSALGVLLTFSSEVWYPAATADAPHWALTPLEDQQLGGLVMWLVGSLPYVAAALALAARWFTHADSAEVALRPSSR